MGQRPADRAVCSKLRAEEAELLGYANYAEVSLVAKMADSTAQVAGFLRELAAKARPFAERDVAELREFARAELGMAKLESWDLAWAAEKLKQARYAFSDEEVKQYFPEPKVLAGLFRVVEALFGVRIEADTRAGLASGRALLPHRRATASWSASSSSTSTRATPSAAAPGWQDAIGRRQTDAGVQTPVAYLCCNFPGAGGRGQTGGPPPSATTTC